MPPKKKVNTGITTQIVNDAGASASLDALVPPQPSYASKEYWAERSTLHWEWYYDYDTLSPLLEDCLEDPNGSVLEIGCGNRPLGPEWLRITVVQLLV